MKTAIISLIILPFLYSCATPKMKLTDAGKNVKILESNKDNGCEVVDKVVGENEKGSPELAKNHARNLAADASGDALYIDDVIQNGNVYKVYATVYRCNK